MAEVEPHPSWRKQPSYSFRAAWLSKKDERRHLAEKLALEYMARGEKVPELLQLALSDDPVLKEVRARREGWHHLFVVEGFAMFDSLQALKQHVKTFCKRSDFGASPWETLFAEREAPVRLSKAQRIRLLDKAVKAVDAYPFADDDEHHFLEVLEPFGEYALALSVEYANFRRYIDGSFGDEDNPVRSLLGKACRVRALAFDAKEEDAPELLAEGVLELAGNTVSVGAWAHSFDDDDEIFESVAYQEVNIASEALAQSIYLEVLDKENETDEDGDDA